MKICVSPSVTPLAAQLSSVRTVVVPTATTRPPRARQASIAAIVDAGMRYHSACIVWSAMFSVFTGWKVPAPTWSVTSAVATPRARSPSSTPASKCSAAVGAATAPGFLANTVW